MKKRVDPCDPRVDSTRPIILRVGYGLTPSLFPGRKIPTHTHIFPSGSGQKMGPGQILPGLVVALSLYLWVWIIFKRGRIVFLMVECIFVIRVGCNFGKGLEWTNSFSKNSSISLSMCCFWNNGLLSMIQWSNNKLLKIKLAFFLFYRYNRIYL